MISARSGGSFKVSTSLSFWDLGVNWGANSVFEVSEILVVSGLVFLYNWFLKPKVAGSNPAGRILEYDSIFSACMKQKR